MNPFMLISHKGKNMVVSDMSNTTPAQAMAAAGELLQKLSMLPPKSALLLIDLTNSQFNQESVNSWMGIAPKVNPFVKAMVIVGAEKLLGVIVSNVTTTAQMPFTNFKTRNEALDWLANNS